MKVLMILGVVVAAVAAVPAPESPDVFRYHELVGIPRAAAIKAAEESGVATSDGRILNGAPAALGQFPFYGGLIIQLAGGGASSCGSSLISSIKLVTAAHCWADGWSSGVSITVVLGSLWLYSGGTRIDTRDVHSHEGWLQNGFDLRDDIAVITIPPVAFSNNILPIALASGSEDYSGQISSAIGMGMTSNTAPVGIHTFLAFIQLPVISNAACWTSYPGYIHDTTVCTASVNGGPCTGDSGGPVTVGNTLVGVVSFGSSGGCEALQPSGHSRVSAYYKWIVSHL